jgi:hypothetical protein
MRCVAIQHELGDESVEAVRYEMMIGLLQAQISEQVCFVCGCSALRYEMMMGLLRAQIAEQERRNGL